MTQTASLSRIALAFTAAACSLAAAPLCAGTGQEMMRTQDAVPPPPVPPQAVEVRRTPPPVAMATEQAERELPPTAVFRVRVTGAAQEIWTGDFTLEGYQGAELRLTLQQGDGLCGSRGEMRYSRRQTGLNLTLRYAGRREDDPFAMGAEWTRQSADCGLPGTRTTGIETTFAVAPGASRVIEADGGLRIEVTRRP